jgi:altronate dehydratase small subunit
MSQTRCFQVHPADNVATALDDIAPGQVQVLGAAAGTVVAAREDILLGHKIALRKVGNGDAIVKFGVPIGIATAVIEPGAWVHLHNCRSQVDERSSHLDLTTGAALDTAYA